MERDSRAAGWGALAALGLCIAIGLAAGGLLVGRGIKGFKGEVRSVTVKGLVEKEVRADSAVWTVGFRRAGDSLPALQSRIHADREAVVAFLHACGFGDAEIALQPVHTTDRFAQDYGAQQPKLRYVVTGAVVVRSARIDAVQAAFGATDELLAQGIPVDGGSEQGRANPHYVVSRFNDLRPALLAEATRNARATAIQFAADAGTRVGAIRSANQGNIQILGSDGNDESGPWSPTSTPTKKIRVVSTFEFELR